MKKSITFLILLLSFTLMAQNKITLTIGGDINNCLFGSAPTNFEPKADLLFKLTIQNNRVMEVGLGAEIFTAIDYNKVFVTVGRRLNLIDNLDFIVSLEPSVIDRTGNWGGGISKPNPKMFFTGGVSTTLRYKPIDNIFFELQGNITYRRDLKAQYNESNTFKPSVYFSIGIDLSKKIRKWD